jgi:23S rRNA pseudouridine955/2504/2580 synthase
LKEILIDKNENEQRLDRFLKKYLSGASLGFIYKMIRKKNIKVNGKKASPETIIYSGDKIELYFSDELLEKLISDKATEFKKFDIDICYEDKNIILINKPVGKLSHSTNDRREDNVVDDMIAYLIQKKEYIPRLEKTFTPSICNRLDRNTSGIIIGAKNYESLKAINDAIKNNKIKKYYKTLVLGKIDNDFVKSSYLVKDDKKNKSQIYDNPIDNSKSIETSFKVIKNNQEYTLLEVELLTGRTHQIRAQLSEMGYPIIGDIKYGVYKINSKFDSLYGLKHQLLHAYKVVFAGLEGELSYLNNREFEIKEPEIFLRIEKDLF